MYLGGYSYVRDRIGGKHIYWKREEYKNKCKGRVVYKGNAFIKKGNHNHPGRPIKLQVRKALSKVKNLASTSAKTSQAIIESYAMHHNARLDFNIVFSLSMRSMFVIVTFRTRSENFRMSNVIILSVYLVVYLKKSCLKVSKLEI
jgi:hypothetical protein